MTIQRRMLPPTDGFPPGQKYSTQSANGRVYDPKAAAYQDVEYQDANVLGTSGWTHVCWVGPTASRPKKSGPSSGVPVAAAQGLLYWDTDLGKMIVMSNDLDWHDCATGLAV